MAQLPEELIAHVFAHVEDSRAGTATLRNASLASRTFSRIVDPFLYESLHCHGGLGRSASSNMSNVLESLFLKPERQRCVRSLSMATGQLDDREDWEVMRSAKPPNPNNISSELSKFMLDAVERLRLPTGLRCDFYDRIEECSEDAKLAVFICICTNLRQWELECGYHRLGSSLIIRVLHESMTSLSFPRQMMPLQHLKHLLVEGWSTHFQEASLLLAVPSLESFGSGTLAYISSSRHECISNAAALRLRDAGDLDGDDIDTLFDIFPQLKSLHLEWDEKDMQSISRYVNIGETLDARAASLTDLQLDVSNVDGTHSHNGSLSGLIALRRLTLPLPYILGPQGTGALIIPNDEARERLVDILPESLEELTLNDCRSDSLHILDAQIAELLADHRFLHLRKITMIRPTSIASDLGHRVWVSSETEEGADKYVTLRRIRS